jgi:hypothetical protein
MIAKPLKYQRDFVPTEWLVALLTRAAKKYRSFISYLTLNEEERYIMTVLNGEWVSFSGLERRTRICGTTHEAFRVMIDGLITRRLVEYHGRNNKKITHDRRFDTDTEYTALWLVR